MDENTVAAGKSYTLFTFLCAIDEAKEGNYDNALQTGVVAVAGTLVCLEEGDVSCLDLLDEIIRFMDRVSTKHPEKRISEQRMLDAITMTLSGLDKISNSHEWPVENAKVRYLYRAMTACEEIDQEEMARTYEKKSFAIIRNLRRNKALSCWLEYSKLCMHKSMSNVTDADNSLKYAKKAYRIAQRGCRTKSVSYRNKCYKQMLECSDFLEYAYSIYHQNKETWKWRLCFFLSLLAWGATNFMIAIASFFTKFGEITRSVFKKYGWRLLQLLYIAWLGWLIAIVIQQLLNRLI